MDWLWDVIVVCEWIDISRELTPVSSVWLQTVKVVRRVHRDGPAECNCRSHCRHGFVFQQQICRIENYLSEMVCWWILSIFRSRRSRSTAAYSRQTFSWTICRSVRTYIHAYVHTSVCPVHCGKTEDRIRMPFVIGQTGPGMRQVVHGVCGSVHGKGYFWGRICGTPL